MSNTINRLDLTGICRTVHCTKHKMHILFKYTQNIYQGRPYSEPQNNSQ